MKLAITLGILLAVPVCGGEVDTLSVGAGGDAGLEDCWAPADGWDAYGLEVSACVPEPVSWRDEHGSRRHNSFCIDFEDVSGPGAEAAILYWDLECHEPKWRFAGHGLRSDSDPQGLIITNAPEGEDFFRIRPTCKPADCVPVEPPPVEEEP